MEAAATDGAGGPSGDPWERAVRSVTLAARADVLHDMAKNWQTYAETIAHYADKFAAIWKDLSPEWTGPAAEECDVAWQAATRRIRRVGTTYAAAKDILETCAGAVEDATRDIPIPIFSGGNLPGGNGKGALNGPILYDDYQNDRGEYGDYAFLRKALSEDDAAQGIRTGKGKGYTEQNTRDDPALYDKSDDQLRKAAVNNWYGENQVTANNAHAALVGEYTEAAKTIPSSQGIKWDSGNSADSHEAPSGTRGTGGVRGGGYTADDGSPTLGSLPVGASGANSSARSLPHVLPPHAVLGPPDTRFGGSGHEGVSPGTSLAAAPGTGLSSPADLPSIGGAAGTNRIRGGADGGAGVGAVGIGAAALPSTTSAKTGWWETPTATPVGSPAPSPAALKAAGAGPGSDRLPGGVGMLPNAGTGHTKATAQEDYTTWLKEDDDEIWGPRWEDQPTGLVE